MVRSYNGRFYIKEALHVIASLITQNGKSKEWLLKYPERLAVIDDLVVIEKCIDNAVNNVFVVIKRVSESKDSVENTHYLEFCIGTGFNIEVADMEDKEDRKYAWPIDSLNRFHTRSNSARLYWTTSKENINDWLRVEYSFFFGKGYFQLVLRTDANLTGKSYTACMYAGELDLFKNCDGTIINASEVNYQGNFGFFVTSEETQNNMMFGDNTSNAVTSVCVLETMSGVPMQAHYLAFTTTDEFLPKNIDGPGKWTDSYFASKMYLFNKAEGYMGKLKDTFAVNLAGLVPGHDKKMKMPDGTENLYTVFQISSKYHIFQQSPNVLSGIAFLKEGPKYTESVTTHQEDFSKWTYKNNFLIEGVITNDNGGAPLQGCTVKIYNNEFSGEGVSLETGAYSIKGIPYGTYTLELYDSNGTMCLTEEITITELKTVKNLKLGYIWITAEPSFIVTLTGAEPTFKIMLHPSNIYVRATSIELPGSMQYTYDNDHKEYTLRNIIAPFDEDIIIHYGNCEVKLPFTSYEPSSINQYLPPIDIEGTILVMDVWDYGEIDFDTIRVSRNEEIVAEQLVTNENVYRLYIRELQLGENIIKIEGMRSDEGAVSVGLKVYDYDNKPIRNYAKDTENFLITIPVPVKGEQEEPYPAIYWKVTRRK